MESRIYFIVLSIFFLACSKYDGPAPIPKSDAKKITAFTFKAADNEALGTDVTATMDEDVKRISATVPHQTDRSSLLPTITVSPKATFGPTGARDFSNAVSYTVTAEDGSSTNYTVTVDEAKSDAKQLLSFVFRASENNALSQDVEAEINEEEKTVISQLPRGTDPSALLPDIEVSPEASATPEGEQDFTDPVKYSVTAADGSTATYTVTVTVALSEKEILLKIAEANPGKLDWKESDDMSDWNEVVLNAQEKVVQLEIDDHGLEVLPPEIGQLVHLKDLDLPYNKLKSLPVEMGELTNLTLLILRGNPIEALPSWIGRLENLKLLDIGICGLSELPKEIVQLTQLEYLDLDGNEMFSLPSEIGQLKNLLGLEIENNMLNSLPPEIGGLVRLEYLQLNDNQLKTLPFQIGLLSKLESLSLNNNLFESLPPEIGRLSSLRKLVLSDNKIGFLPREMGDLTALVDFSISNNEIRVLPDEIGDLSNLQFLFALDNQLKSVPRSLGNLKKLKRLLLADNNELRDLPLEVCNLDESRGGNAQIDIIDEVICVP